MSLVNDMLRDLEARKIPLAADADYAFADDGIDAGGSRRRTAIAVVGLGVVVFTVTTLAWRSPGPAAKPGDEKPQREMVLPLARSAPPAVAVVTAPVPAADPAEAPAADPTKAPEADPSKAPTADPAEIRVLRLLREAREALAADRLTVPAHDSAYQRYLAVLAQIPDHPHAVNGMRAIVDRYLALAREAQQRGDSARMLALLARARRVGGDSIALDEGLAVAERLALHAAAPAAAGSPVAVRPSFSERDKQVAHRARTAIERRRFAVAEQLLREFVRHSPQSRHALYALFQLHLQRGDPSAAEQLLVRARHLPAHRFAHMKAQLLVAGGDAEAAIAAMEAQRPTHRQAPDYYRYLAGLYHRVGRYRQAAAGYRRLLQDNNADGAYWLGLAVCLDALQDKRGALQAFLHANRFSAADAQTQPYIKQRIRALSG